MTAYGARYVVVTPVRDEEMYIEHTLRSVISQTTRPAEWVIVNDGSTDKTGEIIDRYAASHPWIRVVTRKNRGFRKAGGGVIEAFFDGYGEITTPGWEYVVKLDGDLSFDSGYFEECFRRFIEDPRLGIGGGSIYNLENGVPVLEPSPAFHVRGATKIYRRKCWEEIGGLKVLTGWDTIDELKANMVGWNTKTFPELRLIQHKTTGSADGTWNNYVKNGLANYITGYHPTFMMLKCIKRLGEKPYILVSAGLFWGFLKGYLQNLPQVDDKELIRYVRKQQWDRLFLRQSLWS
jgi:glycosyltransferase involved in cell wall biosynthesis